MYQHPYFSNSFGFVDSPDAEATAMRHPVQHDDADAARCEAAGSKPARRQTKVRFTAPSSPSVAASTPAMIATPSVVKSFQCIAGTSNAGGTRNIYIRSPRTGRTIIVDREKCKQVNARIFCRVVKARAEGNRLVTFTRDELVSLATMVGAIAPAMSSNTRPA